MGSRTLKCLSGFRLILEAAGAAAEIEIIFNIFRVLIFIHRIANIRATRYKSHICRIPVILLEWASVSVGDIIRWRSAFSSNAIGISAAVRKTEPAAPSDGLTEPR
jgi:hypothetical protein